MADLSALVSRLEAVASRLESSAAGGGSAPAGGGGGGGGDAGATNASVEAFDEIIAGPFKDFLDKSAGIGGDVQEVATIANNAFAAQRAFLAVVAGSKKPSDTVFASLIGDTSKYLTEASAFKDSKFKSKMANHVSGIAEGLPALGWVTISPKPAPYVNDMTGAAQFYTNRVIKENKESDRAHVDWARSFTKVLTDLEAFVKKHHTTGLVWNPNGGEAKAGAATAAAPAKAAAPTKPKFGGGGGGGGGGGLFAAISKGGAVTSGLKKVDKSEMTHKNPELRTTSVVTAKTAPKKAAPTKAYGASAVKKDPVFELQGKKWVVEFQEGNSSIAIESEGTQQTVYIYKCNNSTVQIKGKVSAITMDSCKKCAVVFEDCVAAFEVINCQSMQAQTTGKVQTISIDKTDGAQVYLSEACIGADIITAKSSEMNIMVPNKDDEGQFLELAVPEQFKTTFDPASKSLKTECTDIAG